MPVSSNIKVEVPQKKTYDPLPKDVYHCELLEVEDREEQGYMTSEMVTKINFQFVVIEEGEHYGRRLFQNCSTKLSKYKGGSNLYKTLVGLNGGKELTDEQMADPEAVAGPDALNELIGTQVRLSVGQKEKKTKPGEYRNIIESFLPVKEELPAFDEEKMGGGDDQDQVEKAVADVEF